MNLNDQIIHDPFHPKSQHERNISIIYSRGKDADRNSSLMIYLGFKYKVIKWWPDTKKKNYILHINKNYYYWSIFITNAGYFRSFKYRRKTFFVKKLLK